MKKRLGIIMLTVFLFFSQSFVTFANSNTALSAVPISSVSDFAKIERNPEGSYYLTQDIELPENAIIFRTEFFGVLDGNGYSLKNLKVTGGESYFGLFGSLRDGAIIKNLKVENVDINIESESKNDLRAEVLCTQVRGGRLENIEISGNMKISKKNAIVVATALGELGGGASVYNVVSDLDYNICTQDVTTIIAGMANCEDVEISSCVNKGDISVDILKGDKEYTQVHLAGVSREINSQSTIMDCENIGNITIESKCKSGNICIAGVSTSPLEIKRCSNKGDIYINGFSKDNGYVGGVVGCSNQSVEQCFNKGTITTEHTNARIGGVAGTVIGTIKNCYNVGKISSTGSASKNAWYVGGIAGYIEELSKLNFSCCYQTGKIKTSSKAVKGSLCGWLGNYSKKSTVKNNYYTRSIAPFGNVANKAKATKVKSINKKNCKGLSSKVWKYSSEKKRMILKNNPE